DVYTSGRFVEDEQPGLGDQPPRQQYFLLVADRERIDGVVRVGRANVERLDVLVHQLVATGRWERTGPAPDRLQRKNDVLADRQLGYQPLGLAVLRAERDRVGDRGG